MIERLMAGWCATPCSPLEFLEELMTDFPWKSVEADALELGDNLSGGNGVSPHDLLLEIGEYLGSDLLAAGGIDGCNQWALGSSGQPLVPLTEGLWGGSHRSEHIEHLVSGLGCCTELLKGVFPNGRDWHIWCIYYLANVKCPPTGATEKEVEK